jgi:hypothetical protein
LGAGARRAEYEEEDGSSDEDVGRGS